MPMHYVEELSADDKLRDKLWEFIHKHHDCKVSQVVSVIKGGDLKSIIVIMEKVEE